MEIKLLLGVVASVVAVASFIPYLRDILKKQTQPHAYSWLIWTILQAVGVVAQFKDGAGYGVWALTISVVYCFVIFLLSFKYGTKNITRFDGLCLGGSLIAIIFYITLTNPLWAVFSVVIIDFIGFLPTFRKGYEEPTTETVSTFALSALANLLSLFALQNYTMVTVIYMASLFITNSAFVSMIMIRKRIIGIK